MKYFFLINHQFHFLETNQKNRGYVQRQFYVGYPQLPEQEHRKTLDYSDVCQYGDPTLRLGTSIRSSSWQIFQNACSKIMAYRIPIRPLYRCKKIEFPI